MPVRESCQEEEEWEVQLEVRKIKPKHLLLTGFKLHILLKYKEEFNNFQNRAKKRNSRSNQAHKSVLTNRQLGVVNYKFRDRCKLGRKMYNRNQTFLSNRRKITLRILKIITGVTFSNSRQTRNQRLLELSRAQ